MKFNALKFSKRIWSQRPDNLKIALLCIATAATFWVFSALNEPYDTSVRYPVQWIFDKDTYIVVDELPDKIRMNVNGMGWNLLRASFGLKVRPLSITLSNPANTKSIAGISLTTEVAEELEGLELNYIVDDTLRLNIDEIGTREFAVYIDSSNISIAQNHLMVSPLNYDVDLVSFTGPVTMLNAMPPDSFLVIIEENEIDRGFDDDVPFIIDRPDLFEVDPPSTHVTFAVTEFESNNILIPISIINLPDKSTISLTDTMAVVAYDVFEELAETILADSFSVVADISLVNPMDSTILLSLDTIPNAVFNARLQVPQLKISYNE